MEAVEVRTDHRVDDCNCCCYLCGCSIEKPLSALVVEFPIPANRRPRYVTLMRLELYCKPAKAPAPPSKPVSLSLLCCDSL